MRGLRATSRARAARVGVAALAVAPLVGLGLGLAPASAAAPTDCTEITQRTDKIGGVTVPSVPYGLLGIQQARAEVPDLRAGQEPVRVAVLDTGVASPDDDGFVIHATHPVETGDDGIQDSSGTEVAGLVAGADRDLNGTGIAPEAQIVDVQVAAARLDDRSRPPSAKDVAEGLAWVADNARALHIKVATVAFALDSAEGLKQAVQDAREAGVVVVAAVGDPDPDTVATDDDGQPLPATDEADKKLLPAFPGVVAVNTTGGGYAGTFTPVTNSDTTVAVPSANAVTYAMNGETCRISVPTTSAATAEVAGVLALLAQRFPDDKPDQLVARLVNTASGTTDDPTPLTGYGLVQPLDALTRPVDPAPDGAVARSRNVAGPSGPVTPPRQETDLLATTRDDAVWWGLIGGGLIVVALLLRPVLARRRS